MTRWRGIRRFTNAGSIPCDQVREAISAELDGEVSSLRANDVRSHVSNCEECLRFRAATRALNGRVGLQVSRPVPADLKDRLARELDPIVIPSSRHWRRIGRVSEWRGGVRWVGALAPAVFVAVVLPLGALSTPRAVPTHAPTPCTISLRHLQWKTPGITLTPGGAHRRQPS
jgi:anti-sigma factor RsiW